MNSLLEHLTFLKKVLAPNVYPSQYKYIACRESSVKEQSSYYLNVVAHRFHLTEYDPFNTKYGDIQDDELIHECVNQNPEKHLRGFLDIIKKREEGESTDCIDVYNVDFKEDLSVISIEALFYVRSFETGLAEIDFKYCKEINKWFYLNDGALLILDVL
jgi:hypothetical protein